MAIVTGGLGQPEEGALVAGGLGHSVALQPGSMSAHLSGTGALAAAATADGHLSAGLSGSGSLSADLSDGSTGSKHSYGTVTGVTTSTGLAAWYKHSSGASEGSTTSTGHAGSPPAPSEPPAVLPPLFGISLEPSTLHRRHRSRGSVGGRSTSVGTVRGVSRRRSLSIGANVSSTTAVAGRSRLVNDDDEVMLLLGYLTPVG